MKRFFNLFGFGFLLASAILFSKPADAQPRMGVSINFQTFYDELSPYGDWVDYPEYGYTWRPRLGSDFRPYATNGSWAYTADNDWMWNSGYDWGWAPFHYGRWFYDPMYGWLWVPGYEWSPAWVAWRGGGDYYGWAPIRPGISINIGFGGYNPPYDYWTFAPNRYMTSIHIGRHFYPYRNNVTIFNQTTIINNYYGGRGNSGRRSGSYYTNGPRRTDVERYTGRINPMSVRSSSRPGRATVSRNAISVYRPSVSRTDSRSTYAPRNVERYDRNSVTRTDASRSRGSEIRSSDRRSGSGNDVRVNTSPRREDAITRGRNTDAGNDGRNRSYSAGNSEGIRSRTAEAESRRQQSEAQRSIETRQRNAESQQRSMEARQRNTEAQQRSMESRQRNVEAQQRSVESRQRNAEAQQQRSMEMRQQQEAQQRSSQMRAQREQQSRSREVQPEQRQSSSPRFESRAPSRSMESRSSGSSPRAEGGDRGSRGGGRVR